VIRLSEWARINGYSYSGAYNLFKQGKLPVKAEQLPSGTILVQDAPKTSCKVTEEASGRNFNIELDLDINACGLSGEDQRGILDEIGKLADTIAHKIGFAGKISKLWRP
jgi:hypothetical protein